MVTSPTGAVIRDILHRLEDRFPRRVIVWPVLVQGEGAAEQVAAAISGFSALPAGGPVPRPDVLIVARGGGSIEDLWAFNEEAVVRAAAACTIPLISAVGHETDTTLIDHAADRRAPTPTAAAEMAVPVRRDLLLQLAASPTGMEHGADRAARLQLRERLGGLARGLCGPRRSSAWRHPAPRRPGRAAAPALAGRRASAAGERLERPPRRLAELVRTACGRRGRPRPAGRRAWPRCSSPPGWTQLAPTAGARGRRRSTAAIAARLERKDEAPGRPHAASSRA